MKTQRDCLKLWTSSEKIFLYLLSGGVEAGFRDLQDFNTTLLVKQFWRLIDKPECLFSKVFKGRYFWNTDPLENHRSYSSSYGWRSICSARSLVKNGLIKRMGTGQSISVWTDPWIPALRPRSALPKKSHSIFKPLFKSGTSH